MLLVIQKSNANKDESGLKNRSEHLLTRKAEVVHNCSFL